MSWLTRTDIAAGLRRQLTVNRRGWPTWLTAGATYVARRCLLPSPNFGCRRLPDDGWLVVRYAGAMGYTDGGEG